jgi:predicted TIM-barrel fold metal-dependent hydrolase
MATSSTKGKPNPEHGGATSPDITLIDCDVHPTFQGRWQDEIVPYVSDAWARKIAGDSGYKGADKGTRDGLSYVIPSNGLFPMPQNPVRNDLVQPGLPSPCSDPELTARDLFDGYGIDRAILVPIASHQQLHHPKLVSVVANAFNSHLEEHWLAKDARWRGLISVPWVSPDRAVKEIDQRASTSKQWVGAQIMSSDRVMGHEMFWPIYEACEHHGLAVQVHVSGINGMYHNGGGFAGGLPLHHMDYRVAFGHADQNNMASMVSAGVFERFPKLRFVMAECGYAWLPQLMWQMDSFWKGNREDTPWLQRPPSEYILEHVRFTTQPFIEPPKRDYVDAILEMVQADRTMMFSTDYPHWDADEPIDVFRRLPEKMRDRIAYKNAIETYGHRIL